MRTATLLALAALAAAGHAAAQPLDMSKGGPVEITARDGFEWHDTEQLAIATGDARAVRDNVTVLADKLVARVRKKATTQTPGQPTQAAAKPAAPAATPASGTMGDTGDNEIYRLEAHGNVRIVSTTDEAIGDDAIYDMDQAVLLLTGKHLKLTTPQQIITARDSLEYWANQHMAVGRGNAVVVTDDGRRLSADVVVAYTTDDSADKSDTAKSEPKPAATPAAAKPATPNQQGGIEGSGKIQRIEAFGNVEVRTQVDTVRGDRGVYVPDTGIAIVEGHARITHNNQQFNGAAADVNMKTGIARLRSAPSERTRGVIVPNEASTDAKAAGPAQPGKATP